MESAVKRNEEVIESIKVGLKKPKLYKRSVWNKAVKVMEFLVTKTNEIEKTYLGSGLEKYRANVEITDDKLIEWANIYNKQN